MSITVNAVDLSEYTYKKYFHDTYYDKYYIAISKEEFDTDTTATGDHLYDLRTGLDIDISQIQDWYTVSNTADAYLCVYTLSGWELSLGYGKTGSSPYVKYISPVDYELTTVPADFPDLDLTTAEELELQFQQEIQQLKEELNATTATSAEANRMLSVITEKTQQYENGEIKNYELQNAIDLTSGYLDELSQNSTNTIADNIAINNAQNAVMLAQEKLNGVKIDSRINQILVEYKNQHELSEVWSLIEFPSNMDELYLWSLELTNGIIGGLEENIISTTQASEQLLALNNVANSILMLDGITEKDISLINSLQNTAKTNLLMINNMADVDIDLSTKSEQADQEELELLNEMISVMQDQSIENKFQDQQFNDNAWQINKLMDTVLNNKFFNYLIGTSGVIIIACILLHTRYRML